jgi:hypothetical protein
MGSLVVSRPIGDPVERIVLVDRNEGVSAREAGCQGPTNREVFPNPPVIDHEIGAVCPLPFDLLTTQPLPAMKAPAKRSVFVSQTVAEDRPQIEQAWTGEGKSLLLRMVDAVVEQGPNVVMAEIVRGLAVRWANIPAAWARSRHSDPAQGELKRRSPAIRALR